MSKSTIITILVLIVILILVGVVTFSLKNKNQFKDSEATRTLTPETATANTYTDMQGNPIDLSIYNGKVRVVNSWASWCPFCGGELPDLSKLGSEYKDKGVVVIAINRKESNERATAFLKTIGDTNAIVFVQDLADSFYQSIGGFSMPETIFYDKAGNISTHKRGFMKFDEMKTLTEKALNATNGS